MTALAASTLGIKVTDNINKRMSLTLLLIFTFIALLAIETGYIPLARKNKWSTERNRRSDGHPVTVIGGGIIFYIAMVIWCLAMGIIYRYVDVGSNFIVGLTMVASCSFADDLMQLKVWIRLVVQFVAVAFLGLQYDVLALPWFVWPCFLLLTVAFVNAYNFMDGINGITAAYSLSVLSILLWVNTFQVHFMPGSMIAMALIALVVFAFFNYRKRARVFAGDVGSITMGYIVASVLVYYMLETGYVTALIMISVYGVDTALTVLRRLSEGENIFRPHRKHIYQMLNYVWKCSQLKIANGYALLQIAITLGYLQMQTPMGRALYCMVILSALATLYFILMMASENKRRRIGSTRSVRRERNASVDGERRKRKASAPDIIATRQENSGKHCPQTFDGGSWN